MGKIGVDDYLAQGHTLADLKAMEKPIESVKTPPRIVRFSTQYDVIDGIICWLKPSSEGIVQIPLCNFEARATEDIVRDNGLETSRYFKIEGTQQGDKPLPAIEVPSASFSGLAWVTDKWGMQAIIAAGQNSKDRLREALQLQSRQARRRTLYTHTGWREIEGQIYFLSGSGAMGRDDIEVELEPSLQRYKLVRPDGDPVEAIKKSFNFHLVANPEVTMPLWAGMYLAPLSELIDTSFTLWLVGASGSLKSTITALLLCHFGNFDSRHLPASWRDSQNTLERLLFICKDMPLVIDDWAPGQDSAKSRDLEAKAEYIIRAQGNRQGRQRMKADTSIRAGYPPRGLLITSGEQIPSGHSNTARIFSLEIEKSDVDLTYLTNAQDEQYYYCVAMSHYIAWLKTRWQELKVNLPKLWREYRDKAQEGQGHLRMPEVIAGLTCAVDLATEFAMEKGVITGPELESCRKSAWQIFTNIALKQSGRIELERPCRRALKIWGSMLATGTAVLRDKDDLPQAASPGQKVIGWLDKTTEPPSVLLEPTAAYGVLPEYGSSHGQPFTIKEDALWKDMDREGLIEHINGRIKSQMRLDGKRPYVVKIKNLGVLYKFSEVSEVSEQEF